jgi:hypothetical protein
MRYRYFISYAHQAGYGNTELHRDQPISSHDDVATIGNQIAARNNLTWACVLNFQQYSEPRTAFDE